MSNLEIFNYKDVVAEDVEAGSSKLKVRWLITEKTGAGNFAMRLFEMKPEGYSPFHKHPWEHEVFILKGKGIIQREGENKSFEKGDVVFIPPNEKHQFKNIGEETVNFICMIPLTGKRKD